MKERLSVLSHNIRYLRKQKGMNQEQLAFALEIKRSNIAAYEAKNVEPRLRIILELAKYFDIDLRAFLDQKIQEDTPLKGFSTVESDNNKVADIDLSNISIKSFTEKSIQVRKILIGFKTFYEIRKTQIKQLSPGMERIMSDIDNFIMVMEHQLRYNEAIIKAISTIQKD